MIEKDIYMAAGCFWGAEHYLNRVDGVTMTEVGYANGNTESPTYEEVYTDTTGHAETVHVRYDAQRVSLKHLIGLYFEAIDPTSLNEQGNDVGTRYRTGIYYTDPADKAMIDHCVAQEAKKYAIPIRVEVMPLKCFYRAEDYHQNYLVKNPDGYCHIPPALFVHAASTGDKETPKKNQQYATVLNQVKGMLDGEKDTIARMANTAALLHQTFGFWWTGFYRVDNGELLVGPFQGPVACMHIAYGRGVCGTAWQEQRTLTVPDVHSFPGHIACSSESLSEIVVPVRHNGEILAVLDIDSKVYATFDDCDRYWLEQIADLVISEK